MNLKTLNYGFNFLLVVVCVAHILSIFDSILNPDLPELKIIDKDLKDIKFPFLFRICVDDLSMKKYKRMGYNNDWEYFLGRSKYNGTIFGWNGHTENGSKIGSVKG